MAELTKPKTGALETEIYRSSPFEFETTAEVGHRLFGPTQTIAQPAWSWFVQESSFQKIPPVPEWMITSPEPAP